MLGFYSIRQDLLLSEHYHLRNKVILCDHSIMV